MRSAPSRCAVVRALVLAGLWLAAAGRPLAFSDAGPHVHYGWGESVRLRHLYTASPHGVSSCFLRIHSDGPVDCAPGQSAHSECPPGPHPPQCPFLPLPPSAPHSREPQVLALPPPPGIPRLQEELGEGAMRAWTYCTHALPSLPSPLFGSCGPTPIPRNARSWHLGVLLPRRAPRLREGLGEVGGGARARTPTNHIHVWWASRVAAAVFCCLRAQV